MPVRVVDTTNLRKNNRSRSFGKLANLVMLEERLNARSEQLGSNIANPNGYFVQSGAYADPTGAVAASLRPINPHFKYINLEKRGYMLVDVDPARAVCEWWHLDTVASSSNIESFAVAFEVRDGTNRLMPSTQTTPRADPPALAP
jgi:alkaline phosphatase D